MDNQGAPQKLNPDTWGTWYYFAPVRRKFRKEGTRLTDDDLTVIETMALGAFTLEQLLSTQPVESANYLSRCVAFAWSNKPKLWIREAILLHADGLKRILDGDIREAQFPDIETMALEVGRRIATKEGFEAPKRIAYDLFRKVINDLRTEIKKHPNASIE